MKKNPLNLPQRVKFCKYCVISNQRPNSTVEFLNDNTNKQTIDFDETNICSACDYNIKEKQQNIDWETRENSLLKLLERFRKNDGSYDVIIPGSGGKDSAYTAHKILV